MHLLDYSLRRVRRLRDVQAVKMENENDLNLDLDKIETQAEEKLKVKNRFEKLSENVIKTSRERDEALAKVQAESQAKAAAEKERDFYKDFSVNVPKYPHAAEYQDKILEKVRGGYSTKDAIVSVLNDEGKLIPSELVKQSQTIAGGSASNVSEGTKSLKDMTAAEKFAALGELEASGDLANALRGR